MNRHRLRLLLQRIYVAILLWVVGRALAATSQVDAAVRAELAALPSGFQIQMGVLPATRGFVLESQGDGRLRRARAPKTKPDLAIRFKHVAHAFLVLSFQEGTARAFAANRMVADGEVAHAMTLVRCLGRMEALILPRWVAERALKRYPTLPWLARTGTALRIYARLARNALLLR